MINRFRTALRMITHWTTGGMLASLHTPDRLIFWVTAYVTLQIWTMILDFVSPPSWKKNE